HGARATTAGANGKAAARGADNKAANPARAQSNNGLDPEAVVPPPVLPSKNTPPNTASRNPSLGTAGTIVRSASPVRARSSSTTPQTLRNAIGQTIVLPRNSGATQPHLLQPSAARPPAVIRGVVPSPVVSSSGQGANPAATAKLATLSNR